MHRRRAAGVLLVALIVGLTTQPAAAASGYSSDKTKPDLSAALAAFNYGLLVPIARFVTANGPMVGMSCPSPVRPPTHVQA